MKHVRKKMSQALMGLALYAVLGIVAPEAADAQCSVGPYSTATQASGSYFSGYQTCSWSGRSARVWLDQWDANGWRHSAAQRVCGQGAGSFRVRLLTYRINSVTGAFSELENFTDQASCLVPFTHQNVSGNTFIFAAACRISIGC